ncbi:class I SAM-dependent methyltransferase [Vallitalea guaymasensis]|uniref:Class I SAM-dependent methyltransferase n=1 Tax=Vallitalea guaymasensis TaxID=1185412 RepID=A0A8J8MC59_9FIRM|nr:class I SAM-dependent methyltransferase [Vallitalea guaymasensis]QUH30201.1 class I SAM-dependent methyltransferase [Vallitalea guaymasensis]
MNLSQYTFKKLNNLFPLPVHPFNLQNQGEKTYAQWQFEKGFESIKYYSPYVDSKEMFTNKKVLDVGCGAAGKSLYYSKQGASIVYGIDQISSYKEQADSLAEKLDLQDKFEFVLGSATNMPFDNNYFDTIILNDAMEHLKDPKKVLNECYRILKKDGIIYINFPPYNHPFGAHLSDTIGIPWVHLFFSEKSLIQNYKSSVESLPDGKNRIDLRISTDENGNEYFSYINKMTIKRFEKVIKQSDFNKMYYESIPLKKLLAPVSKIPFLKEYFTKMIVFIGKK